MRVFIQIRSAELILIRLVSVTNRGHFFDQVRRIKVVGFHEIIEGMAVISQLRIEQAHQEVRVHGGVMAQVHGGNLDTHRIVSKRRSALLVEKG